MQTNCLDFLRGLRLEEVEEFRNPMEGVIFSLSEPNPVKSGENVKKVDGVAEAQVTWSKRERRNME